MKTIGKYIMNVLISIDQLGNSFICGDPDETISSRLGRIQESHGGTIPWNRPVCKITDWFLGKIQKNHCEKAIEGPETPGTDGIFDNRKQG